MRQSRSNRNVSRSRLHSPISTCGWRNSTGKLFHSRGPATEKLLLSRRVSCIRASTSVDVHRPQSAVTLSVWDELVVFDLALCRSVKQRSIDEDSRISLESTTEHLQQKVTRFEQMPVDYSDWRRQSTLVSIKYTTVHQKREWEDS